MTLAKFTTAPKGSTIVVQQGGYVLSASGSASAGRSDLAVTSGGVELTFWGDDALNARVGIVPPAASLNSHLATGYEPSTGKVYVNGSNVATVATAAKGDTLGVVLNGTSLTFKKNGITLGTYPVAAGSYHFAASLQGTSLSVAANAGQWPSNSGTWETPAPAMMPVRISDLDYLATNGDRYEGVIDESGVLSIASLDFPPWGGASAKGEIAQVTVYDPQGMYDSLTDMDLSGATVNIRIGKTPETATNFAGMALDRVEHVSDQRKTFFFRDAHDNLDKPLNAGVFLPNVPKLAWQSQPVLIGKVGSIPTLAVSNDGSSQWIADAPVYVSEVRDRGDLMELGTWTMANNNQQLALQMPPSMPMTVDASSKPDGTPATLTQFLTEAFRRIGKRDWSLTDVQAIDAATGYAGIGLYSASQLTVRDAIDAVLATYTASRWQDANGVLRFTRLIDPASAATPDLQLDAIDMTEDMVSLPDKAPNLSRRMAYRPNARPLADSDFVTDLVDVPLSVRNELSGSHRGTVYSSKPLPAMYRKADTAEPIASLFWSEADAQAELDRVLGLYATERHFYSVGYVGNQPVQPGMIVDVTYPRYNLIAKRCLVRSVERNPIQGTVKLNLWG